MKKTANTYAYNGLNFRIFFFVFFFVSYECAIFFFTYTRCVKRFSGMNSATRLCSKNCLRNTRIRFHRNRVVNVIFGFFYASQNRKTVSVRSVRTGRNSLSDNGVDDFCVRFNRLRIQEIPVTPINVRVRMNNKTLKTTSDFLFFI